MGKRRTGAAEGMLWRLKQRVKIRELGIAQSDYVARVSKLNSILDRARLEDFTVSLEMREKHWNQAPEPRLGSRGRSSATTGTTG
jgi:hypothetical protein